MAMILFNPTNEDMETQYIGEQVIIKSGAKVKVDDPRGRKVMNDLSNRGLVTLEYGDEGEGEIEKGKIGIERNLTFKRKQVLDFNQINEGRFQSKMPYLTPTKQLQGYAKELGIGIREPYNVEDAANEELSELMKQNAELKEQVANKDGALATLQNQVTSLTAEFKQFMKMVSRAKDAGGEEATPDPSATKESDKLKNSYKRMNKKQFISWLANNWKQIQAYPEDVLTDLAEKHQTLYGIPFPDSQPVAGEYEIA